MVNLFMIDAEAAASVAEIRFSCKPLQRLDLRDSLEAAILVSGSLCVADSRPRGPGAAPRASRRKVTTSPGETALQHNDAELINHCYANSAMGGGPEDSAAPATASLAAAQQQKPKTVSRG